MTDPESQTRLVLPVVGVAVAVGRGRDDVGGRLLLRPGADLHHARRSQPVRVHEEIAVAVVREVAANLSQVSWVMRNC